MPRRVSEIAIQFKRPPGTIFPQSEGFNLAANTLSFQIQPDEGLSLILNAKIPGLETRTQPVKMSFRYATTFGSNTPEAYERLVLDAMIGDGTLFIRGRRGGDLVGHLHAASSISGSRRAAQGHGGVRGRLLGAPGRRRAPGWERARLAPALRAAGTAHVRDL